MIFNINLPKLPSQYGEVSVMKLKELKNAFTKARTLAFCGHTWWRKPGIPRKTTDLVRTTTTLPHADTGIRMGCSCGECFNHCAIQAQLRYPGRTHRRMDNGSSPIFKLTFSSGWLINVLHTCKNEEYPFKNKVDIFHIVSPRKDLITSNREKVETSII